MALGNQGLPSGQLSLEVLNFPRSRTNIAQLWQKMEHSQLLQLEGVVEVISSNVPHHHKESLTLRDLKCLQNSGIGTSGPNKTDVHLPQLCSLAGQGERDACLRTFNKTTMDA